MQSYQCTLCDKIDFLHVEVNFIPEHLDALGNARCPRLGVIKWTPLLLALRIDDEYRRLGDAKSIMH
jgi:hypothetical protein